MFAAGRRGEQFSVIALAIYYIYLKSCDHAYLKSCLVSALAIKQHFMSKHGQLCMIDNELAGFSILSPKCKTVFHTDWASTAFLKSPDFLKIAEHSSYVLLTLTG